MAMETMSKVRGTICEGQEDSLESVEAWSENGLLMLNKDN